MLMHRNKALVSGSDEMRVWRWKKFGSLDGLVVEKAPIPQAGPGQVLVRMWANSLNQRDLMIGRGTLPSAALPSGLIPLSDGAGEVAATGAGVNHLKVGDRVIGLFRQRWLSGPVIPEDRVSDLGGGVDGMLAEFVVLAETGLVPFPRHLSFAEAATLPCAAVTAWCALFPKSGLRPGETVLTLGTGTVSLFTVQLAVASGARVIVTTSSDERGERVKEMGAAGFINYRKQPDWHLAALEQTGGAGAGVVIETGGAATYLNSLNSAAVSGRVALVGLITGMAEPGGSFAAIFRRNLTVRAVQPGSRLDLEALLQAIDAAKLRPMIDRAFPFTSAREAFGRLASGEAFGKVVIEHD
jgi:NADPH:quinone reductase-like Zn-dependent oxidoreductase